MFKKILAMTVLIVVGEVVWLGADLIRYKLTLMYGEPAKAEMRMDEVQKDIEDEEREYCRKYPNEVPEGICDKYFPKTKKAARQGVVR